MPIYEYVCQSCGVELEKLQKISDVPLKDCPACGQPELVKKISAAGFRLKGGGWYETDFKSDGKRNLASDSKKGTEKSAAADTGSAKTAEKTTPKAGSEAA